MLEDRDLNTNKMENMIYIQLLNEGTKVYRPVPASEIENKVYRIGGEEIYDPDEEVWEFPPGTVVIVEEQILEGENVLLAIKVKKTKKL